MMITRNLSSRRLAFGIHRGLATKSKNKGKKTLQPIFDVKFERAKKELRAATIASKNTLDEEIQKGIQELKKELVEKYNGSTVNMKQPKKSNFKTKAEREAAMLKKRRRSGRIYQPLLKTVVVVYANGATGFFEHPDPMAFPIFKPQYDMTAAEEWKPQVGYRRQYFQSVDMPRDEDDYAKYKNKKKK